MFKRNGHVLKLLIYDFSSGNKVNYALKIKFEFHFIEILENC